MFGVIASRLKLPLIVGYLAAGIALGPATPGFVADPSVAHQLSEIGVSLLMFGVGLHFSIADLWAVRKVAVPGAILRIVVVSVMGAGVATMWGASFGAGLVFGLCLSISSTVVMLRNLTQREHLETAYGRIAIGWLIVEDLVAVIALVILPTIASLLGGVSIAEEGANVWLVLLQTLIKVSLFAAAMLLIGTRIIPRVLGGVARTGSRELFTIGVLGIALGVAFGASWLFDISPALGAFFAGIVIAESDLSYQAGADTLPMQETFTVLFFVAVGMLFDPMVLVEQPLLVFIALLIVIVGKTLAAAVLVLILRRPLATALAVAASLAQIGEFSFVLVALAISVEILSETARSTIVAVAILSIALNGLVMLLVPNIDRGLRKSPKLLHFLERPRRGRDPEVAPPAPPGLKDHVVMIGYGRVGAVVGEALRSNRVPYAVVEMDRNVVEELRKNNIHAIFGDAARPGILAHANIRLARLLVIATPDSSQAREIINYATKVNPHIEICARTHAYLDEQIYLDLGVHNVVMGERELGLQLALHSLTAVGRTEADAERTIARIRDESGA